MNVPMNHHEAIVLTVLCNGDRPATYAEIGVEAAKSGKPIIGVRVQNIVARLQARSFVCVTHHPTDASESVSITADGAEAIRPALLEPMDCRQRAILEVVCKRDRPATDAEVEAGTTCRSFTGTRYSVVRTAIAVARLEKLGFVCVTHHPSSGVPLVKITADGANALRAIRSRDAARSQVATTLNSILTNAQPSEPDHNHSRISIHTCILAYVGANLKCPLLRKPQLSGSGCWLQGRPFRCGRP